MSNSDRLIERIRALGVELPADIQVCRLYPSASARNAGAWSWCLFSRSVPNLPSIGSQFPVASLVRSGVAIEISDSEPWGDRHIDPVEPPHGCEGRQQRSGA